MRPFAPFLALAALAGLASPALSFADTSIKPVKEWTMLVFLNGNNNLDRFGAEDINEMERVGSTDQINVVVQWASLSTRQVKRVYVKKDTNTSVVNSPVLQDMGTVDMGSWKNLVEFVQWGIKNYPAKRYFVDVWNHGGGWHRTSKRALTAGITPSDISWDDISGNFITTPQLGQAMAAISQSLGRKVDLYGSDACLMAMAEVSNEMKDSVDVFMGSQETEPGDGWPYDDLLTAWSKDQTATPAQVASMLTDAYVKSYSGGSQGSSNGITFSSYNLTAQGALNAAIRDLGINLMTLAPTEAGKAMLALRDTQSYAYADYGDLIDFIDQLERKSIKGLDRNAITAVRDAAAKFILTNKTSQSYRLSHGVSIWLPDSSYSLNAYDDKYRAMRFHGDTGWLDTLMFLYR